MQLPTATLAKVLSPELPPIERCPVGSKPNIPATNQINDGIISITHRVTITRAIFISLKSLFNQIKLYIPSNIPLFFYCSRETLRNKTKIHSIEVQLSHQEQQVEYQSRVLKKSIKLRYKNAQLYKLPQELLV